MALYVVGTPIGNLKDLTERAKEMITNSKVFICEQKKVSLKLLNHLGARPDVIVSIPQSESLPKNVIEMLRQQDGVLVVSSGTPAISDPGSRIVRTCLENGIRVVPVPGASAVTAALSVCGFDTSRFLFLGFIPKKGRKNFLQKIKEGIEAFPFSPLLVIYESPYRTIPTLEDIGAVFGPGTNIFLAREMTKLFEEFMRGTVEEVVRELKARESGGRRLKGEITIIVDTSS